MGQGKSPDLEKKTEFVTSARRHTGNQQAGKNESSTANVSRATNKLH
jgi:hypothetical protein